MNEINPFASPRPMEEVREPTTPSSPRPPLHDGLSFLSLYAALVQATRMGDYETPLGLAAEIGATIGFVAAAVFWPSRWKPLAVVLFAFGVAVLFGFVPF